MPLLSPYHVYPFMDGYGSYIFKCEISVSEGQQCDLSDVGLNSEGSVLGIEYLSNLYLHEKLLPDALADRAVMHDEAVHLFLQGQAGMLIDGSWVISQTVDSGIQYGVTAIPELPNGTRSPRPLTTVHVLAASAYSAFPDETIEFMNYLASPEAVVALHGALGKAPARRDVLRQPVLRDDRELRARLEAWYDQAANGVLLPQAPELGYVWAPWARALDEAIPGLKPAQEALDQAVEQITDYIEPD